MLYPREVLGRIMPKEEYLAGQVDKVPPSELQDEFYRLVHVLPEAMCTDARFALAALVSIEEVMPTVGFSRVRYEFADAANIRESKAIHLERIGQLEVDGAMFIRTWVRSGLFRTVKSKHLPVGYLRSLDEDFDSLLNAKETPEPIQHLAIGL